MQARLALQAEQFRHDNTITPLAPRPGEPVLVEATAGERLPLVGAAVFYTTDGSTPDEAAPSVPMAPAAVDWVFLAGFLTRWRAELPPQPAAPVLAPGDLLVYFNLSAGPRSVRPPAGPGPRLVPLFQTGPAPAGLHQDGPHAALTLPAETGVVLAVAE